MKEIISCLKNRIDDLMKTDKQIVVAIDGNCTAGKTTLAAVLKNEYDCNVFHMDDFFLRPQQRTAERYAEPGGNVDYERFQEEVLIPLKKGSAFSYRPFSCKTFSLSDAVEVTPKALNIVEGTYCLHPYFGDVYDLKLFPEFLQGRNHGYLLQLRCPPQRFPDTQKRPLTILHHNRYPWIIQHIE